MKRITALLAVLLVTATAACTASDDPNAGDTTSANDGSTPTSEASTLEMAVIDMEASILDVQAEAEEADLPADLLTEWEELETQLENAIDAIGRLDFDAIDTDTIQSEALEFTNAVNEAGDELSAEFRDAWDSLRTNLDTVVSSIDA